MIASIVVAVVVVCNVMNADIETWDVLPNC